ncbi:MAG TPA: creatininase family protein [Candidatus Nanopelagicaceae bacterium]
MPRHPERQLERISQPVAAELIKNSGVAVITAGSIEQHGSHLPLGTDLFAALSIAERVAFRLDTVVVTLGSVGIAHYHGGWGGSLTLSPDTMIAVFVDICAGLRFAGAERIVVVNWHEGNSATLRLAADKAQRLHDLQIVIAETHIITNSLHPEEMEFTHAGAMETSAVLAYDASLVHMEKASAPSDRASGDDAHALFRRRDVYPILLDFHDIAPTGWYGHPERAEVGRSEEIAEEVADHVVRQAKEIWAALSHPGSPS